jgi:membrane-associated HD superfamily phosphohydrolase
MNNIHDWINSALLLVFVIAYFLQDRHLKYMKSAMDAIDPDKIKSAQSIIEQGRQYEMKLQLNKEIDRITKQTGTRFQQVNKDFHEMFNELISIPFGIMKDMDWQEREQHLKYYPKNAEYLRAILAAYDKGDFPPKDPSDKNDASQ